MTSGQVQVTPAELDSAAAAYDKESQPLQNQADSILTGIKGNATTAGTKYASSGTSYHTAVTGLKTILEDYSKQAEWMSQNLTASADNYSSSDTSGASTINASGAGS
jgi:uncharacterized protein YukE